MLLTECSTRPFNRCMSHSRPRRCKNCKKESAGRPRGLCWKCYYNPKIRDKFQPLGGEKGAYGSIRYDDLIRIRSNMIPLEPTDAEPGSEKKIEIMRQRYLNGEALYHPKDRKINLK